MARGTIGARAAPNHPRPATPRCPLPIPALWPRRRPVAAAAPFAEIISPLITPSQIVTLSTADGDLLFAIRASALDDKSLMSQLSVEQLTDFFLYTKEVHSLIADRRSLSSGRLCRVR